VSAANRICREKASTDIPRPAIGHRILRNYWNDGQDARRHQILFFFAINLENFYMNKKRSIVSISSRRGL
jgi:hypothetical protein